MMATPRWTLSPILRGVGLIARGRAAGLNCFRDTPQAFFYSLAPGFGIMAASIVQGLAVGKGVRSVAEIPGTVCVLLAPSVLSYEMARFWGREAFWNRYIVAFNWCQWLLPIIAFLLLIVLGIAQPAGLDPETALPVLIISLAGYALWLNWFLARHGLALNGWRAAGLVAAVNAGTMAIVFGPTFIAAYFG
jgi:F0F1-type ATP synthase membrane subunit c/vacuolar-type H+-ATPase subunit K